MKGRQLESKLVSEMCIVLKSCKTCTTLYYRRVPRDIPPPPPPPKKNGPCLNERIDVIMNAAACYSLNSCWSTSSFLEFRNRCAEALTSTKIRSFKYRPFFFGGGGGGGGGDISRYSTVCVLLAFRICSFLPYVWETSQTASGPHVWHGQYTRR